MKKVNMKKTLIPAIATLLMSVAVTAGTTYAWFTSSQESSISDIDVTVSATSGLEVSWDAVHWGSNIKVEDAEYTSNTNNTHVTGEDKVSLSPVSATNEVTDAGDLTFYSATLGDYSNQLKTTSEADSGFIKYDVYIRNSGSSEQSIYLKNGSSVVGKGTDSKDTIGLASRIAFVKENEVTAGLLDGSNPAVKANKKEIHNNEALILEPNSTVHTAEGKNLYTSYGKSAGDTQYDYSAIKGALASTGSAINMYSATATDYLTAATTVAKIEAYTQSSNGKYGEVDVKPLFTITANSEAKITVYIWVEGQDVDCLNNLSGSNLKSVIGFATSKTTA